ncbi:MAG: sugar phosphate isomerase/epimerase family protein [Acidimicrobiia bacterium]
MHDRVSVSAISSFRWDLARDLEFYTAAGITNVGVSVAKLEAFGWDDGVRRVQEHGIRATNLIGLGPFHLDDPTQWPIQRARLDRALDAAEALQAETIVFTTGPAGALTWEEAADNLERAIAPILERARLIGVPFAIEHTNPLRVDVGFVHTLRDDVDLARRLGTGVCVELNACWAERNVAATIRDAVDVMRLVQVSDFRIGTLNTPNRLVPGDGDVPLGRLIGEVLDAGYTGVFDLELIGPAIDDEGYESAVTRSITWLTNALTPRGVSEPHI